MAEIQPDSLVKNFQQTELSFPEVPEFFKKWGRIQMKN